MRAFLKRHCYAVAVLSLGALTMIKILTFLLLFKAGQIQPYVGGSGMSYYLPAASSILTAGAFYVAPDKTRSSKVAPGYPALLALVQWVAPRSYLALAVCLQMICDWVVAMLLLLIGRRQTSVEDGWVAGMAWLLFPPATVISTWIASEALFTCLLVSSMALFMRALSPKAPVALSLIAGVVLGFATLVRGVPQLFPVFLLGVFVTGFFWYQSAMRHWLKAALCLLLGMSVVVLPWTVRNFRVLGEPVVVQTGIGGVFLMGSRSEYFTINGFGQRYTTLERQAAADGLPKPTDGKQTSDDRWQFKLGLREYRLRLSTEPWSLPLLLLHKVVRCWYGSETGDVSTQLMLGLCSLATVPAGLFQLWRWRKTRLIISLLWGSLILYFVLLALVNLPMFRYALPLYPFLIFAASHWYMEIFRHRRSLLHRILNPREDEYARSSL